MTALIAELQPSHPRKASASRRRRYVKQISARLHVWAPGAATVIAVPIGDGDDVVFHVRAMDGGGHLIHLNADERLMTALILRKTWPNADWTQAQTWQASDGLRPTRDRLAGGAA